MHLMHLFLAVMRVSKKEKVKEKTTKGNSKWKNSRQGTLQFKLQRFSKTLKSAMFGVASGTTRRRYK